MMGTVIDNRSRECARCAQKGRNVVRGADNVSLGADGEVGRFRVLRDAYGWVVGDGSRLLERGTLVTGRVMRRNRSMRRIVIDTGQGLLTMNEEDLEPASRPA